MVCPNKLSLRCSSSACVPTLGQVSACATSVQTFGSDQFDIIKVCKSTLTVVCFRALFAIDKKSPEKEFWIIPT